jgi:hypothetical protein
MDTSDEVNVKMYHWCPNHKKWCIHTPVECKALTTKANCLAGNLQRPEEDLNNQSKRKLEHANTCNAFITESDDDGNNCI